MEKNKKKDPPKYPLLMKWMISFRVPLRWDALPLFHGFDLIQFQIIWWFHFVSKYAIGRKSIVFLNDWYRIYPSSELRSKRSKKFRIQGKGYAETSERWKKPEMKSHHLSVSISPRDFNQPLLHPFLATARRIKRRGKPITPVRLLFLTFLSPFLWMTIDGALLY